MHNASLVGMKNRLAKYVFQKINGGIVIDLGSQDINGTYREHFGPAWKYLGVDINKGKNVDVVMSGEYSIPIANDFADLLISGQCLEHVRNPFRLIKEAVRTLRKDGLIICVAPHIDSIHRYPIDTFRYNPDGMEAIFDEANCEKIESMVESKDCWYVGVKK